MLQIARLPAAKLLALKGLLTEWSARKWCTRVQLESLIDKLHHACLVVWPGRTFLHRMINLLYAFRSRDHPIRLNVEFRLDLQWWIEFLHDSRQVSSCSQVSCPWRTYVLHQMLLALSGKVHYGCPLKCQCLLPTKSSFHSLLPLISGVISGPTCVVLLCLLKN